MEVFLSGFGILGLFYFERIAQDLNTKICATYQNNHSKVGMERTK